MSALLNLSRRIEDHARRERRRGAYRGTVAFQEANLYRVIVKRSYLPANGKALLLSFVSRWFRHGKPGQIAVASEALMKKLGWCRNTLRRALRPLIDAGYLVVMAGGRGRGNVTEYFVDLPAIQADLDDKAVIAAGAEEITFEGEIRPSVKGSFCPRAYKDSLNLQRWKPLRFIPATIDPVRTAWALAERIARNLTRRLPSPSQVVAL